MENEKPPTDIRIHIIVALFFLCIVGGGAFLALYVLRPDSPSWYALAGMVLVGIPWLVWLLTYIYSCIKMLYGNARAMENNAGRIFPKANMSQRSRSTAMTDRTSSNTGQSPTSPAQNLPHENNLHVQFGDDVLSEENSNQDQDSLDDKDDGEKEESQTRGKEKKARESEIPLTSFSSSS
ncbi:hypothetical protein QQ045_009043 [Rhodiola kirilowii]